MATTKKEPGTARHTVIRTCAIGRAGDNVVVDADTAALLVRDGMIAPAEEG